MPSGPQWGRFPAYAHLWYLFGMVIAAFVVSLVALSVSALMGIRNLRMSQLSTSTKVLVDLFTEHRGKRLADAREFIHSEEFKSYDYKSGLKGMPEEKMLLVRDLAWFYDNLGVLVAYRVVDIRPVAGYLGGSVLDAWPRLLPIVKAERRGRVKAGCSDPGIWQNYFEYLYERIHESRTLDAARIHPQRRWYHVILGP
ncbi:hypothetical protein BJD99_10635 [Rhodococcus sp. 1163]|nr:hypothetical protein BJD99_10635 [Rhodococcus sp. 1163]